jgi:hypothetical protein
VSQSFGYIPKSGIAGSNGRSITSLFSNISSKKIFQSERMLLGAVAHTCNLSYSGGRDQEDHGLKAARANSSRDPILKKLIKKKGCLNDSGVGPEFKPQYHKKKERKKVCVCYWGLNSGPCSSA